MTCPQGVDNLYKFLHYLECNDYCEEYKESLRTWKLIWSIPGENQRTMMGKSPAGRHRNLWGGVEQEETLNGADRNDQAAELRMRGHTQGIDTYFRLTAVATLWEL